MLVVALVLGAAAPAWAAQDVALQEEGSTDAEPEVISEPGSIDPAIPVVEESVEAELADPPYRYLLPAALALTFVVLLFTIIQYFLRVTRTRYRVEQ